MFKNKLAHFLVKRAVLILILLSAADFVFPDSGRWTVLAGLLAGALLGIGRLSGSQWILKKILGANGENPSGSMAAYALNQFVLLPVIALAYFLSVRAFYGLIAGLLIIPLIIMVNSITEAFGITKNNFE